MDFIVAEAYSNYTTILARPWLHAIGTVYSTLHVKMKHPTEGKVGELLGCQSVARQCMVVVIRLQTLEVSPSGSDPTL